MPRRADCFVIGKFRKENCMDDIANWSVDDDDDSEYDPPPDGAVQVAMHGVTIADDATPAQAAAALFARRGIDWSMQTSLELTRQVAAATGHRDNQRVQMPDGDGKLPKRGRGGRWV
jgi:hypothetical protein